MLDTIGLTGFTGYGFQGLSVKQGVQFHMILAFRTGCLFVPEAF